MFYNLTHFQFWLWLAFFLPVIVITIFVPGLIIAQRLQIKNTLTKFVLANAFGIVMWGLVGYISGYLNIRFFGYAYCLFSLAALFYFRKEFVKNISSLLLLLKKNNIVAIGLIVIGSLCQLTVIFPSGLKFDEGIKLFGNNSQDGVMHLAYIQSIIRDFPPKEPGLADTIIRNYHYWSDMVIADISRIWRIPVIHLFFQFFPLYLAPIIGLTAYCVVRAWGGGKRMALWFIFLLYFASDAAYLVLFLLQKPLGFYTPAIDSGVQQFLNMPHMFGKLIFLTGLISFHYWIKNRSYKWGLVTVMLFSSLFGFKVYFGIFGLLGMGFFIIGNIAWKTIKAKKLTLDLQKLLMFLLLIIASLLIFLPHNYGAGGLVYVYLEWPRSLLGEGSINWREWWLRRQVYEASGNSRNLLILDLLAVLIAFISIYGSRLVGFVVTKKLLVFLRMEKGLLLLPPLIIFHLLGLFTIQASGGVNVYNFFSVASVILSLFTAFLLSRIKLNLIGYLLIIIFVSFTLPRTIFEVKGNIEKINSEDFRLISNDELNTLNYANKITDTNSVIQAHPKNALDRETPYVSYFTNTPSFYAGAGLLSTHNIFDETRKKDMEEIFKATEIVDFVSKMQQRDIDYIYLQKNPEQILNFSINKVYLQKVYENNSSLLLKIQ